MLKGLLIAFTVTAGFAADYSWSKVRDLKSGAEIRVFKKNSKQPVVARLDEATDENLIVVLKNEQVAIPKDDIERIDARPSGGSRITRDSKTTTEMKTDTGARTPSDSPGPTMSSSSNVSIGSKPDFEIVYQKTAGGSPKKTPPQKP
jgi:hypothetical protein